MNPVKLEDISLQMGLDKKVYLEFLCDFHAESLLKNWGLDPKVFESLTSVHIDTIERVNMVINSSTKRYTNNELMRFAIKIPVIHEPIGLFTLTNHGDNKFEVGYSIGSEHWGKGYVTDALSLIITELKKQKQDITLLATVLEDNPGSERVLTKCGFNPAGKVLRSKVYGEDCTNPDKMTNLFSQKILSIENKLSSSFDI